MVVAKCIASWFIHFKLVVAFLKQLGLPRTSGSELRDCLLLEYRLSASGAVDWALIRDQVNSMTLIGIHKFPPSRSALKGWCRKQAVYLLCRWGRCFAVFPRLGMVGRWLVTPICSELAKSKLLMNTLI